MLPNSSCRWARRASLSLAIATAFAAASFIADARVTKLVVDTKVSPAFSGATFGNAGQYETILGRVFGEIDRSAESMTRLFVTTNCESHNDNDIRGRERPVASRAGGPALLQSVVCPFAGGRVATERQNRKLLKQVCHF
ncbi:MAG TPA: hypothetical protein VGL25_19190 [Casimicrobiaceae bacterium]